MQSMSEEYTCQECGKSFDSKRGLHIHIGEVHPDKKEELLSEEEESIEEQKETIKEQEKEEKEEPEGGQTPFSSKTILASVGALVVLLVAAMLLMNTTGVFNGEQAPAVASNNTSSSLEGEIVAIVNDEPIMDSEVSSMEQRAMLMGQNISRDQIIEQLINQEILIQKAKKEGYSVSKEEVEITLEEQLAQQNMTLEDLKRRVEQQGASWEKQIAKYREQLASQNYIEQEIADQVSKVTEEDVKQFYQRYKNQSTKEVPPLAQIKQQISQTLQQQRQQQAINSVIETIKPNYDIVYK